MVNYGIMNICGQTNLIKHLPSDVELITKKILSHKLRYTFNKLI